MWKVVLLVSLLFLMEGEGKAGNPDFPQWEIMLKNVSRSRAPGNCVISQLRIISPNTIYKVVLGLQGNTRG